MTEITREQLLCKCCGQGAPDGRLVLALNQLQALNERPLEITSGCRCPKHNEEVGGAPNSQHLFGKAADLRCKGRTPLELYLLAEQVPFFQQGGIGLYNQDIIHVDVRGWRARWYRPGGVELPIAHYVTHAG